MLLLLWLAIGVACLLWFVFFINKYQNDWQNYQGKLFNFIIIGFFVFVVLSVGFVYFKSGAKVNSFGDILSFVKVYFYWLGNAFGEIFKISGYAVKQNWGLNHTLTNSTAP